MRPRTLETLLTETPLERAERRYRESLTLPYSPSRDLYAAEYIWALEEALHGSAVAA